MSKIYVFKIREPFDVPREEAERIKNDWLDETIPRSRKVGFSYFTGVLGDIKSFDMRSDAVTEDTYTRSEPLTDEEKERGRKWIKEIGEKLKTL